MIQYGIHSCSLEVGAWCMVAGRQATHDQPPAEQHYTQYAQAFASTTRAMMQWPQNAGFENREHCKESNVNSQDHAFISNQRPKDAWT